MILLEVSVLKRSSQTALSELGLISFISN